MKPEALGQFRRSDNINHLFDEGKEAGFPGSCIASIDCMHWEWKMSFPLEGHHVSR
jgi:hypothetical protein